MKRTMVWGALALAAAATPAWALGIEDLAKVVLGGNSVLKKAEQTCGSNGQLTVGDSATLSTAVEAARRVLVPDRFNALDTLTRADADTQARTPGFCTDTRRKKKGLLSQVKKAGRNILLGGLLR